MPTLLRLRLRIIKQIEQKLVLESVSKGALRYT